MVSAHLLLDGNDTVPLVCGLPSAHELAYYCSVYYHVIMKQIKKDKLLNHCEYKMPKSYFDSK